MMRDVLNKVFSLITGSKRRLFYLMSATVWTSAILDTLGIASVLPLISLIMNPDIVFSNPYLHYIYTWFGFADIQGFIIMVALGILTILLAGNALAAFNTWIKTRFVWEINHDLSIRLLEKYLSQPYVYYLHSNSADVNKNILQEASQLTSSLLMPLINLFSRLTVILLILALLLLVNPLVTLAALLVLGGAYWVIFILTRRKMRSKGLARLAANRERVKTVTDVLGGIKDIKVLARESYFLQRYSLFSRQHAELLAWNSVISSIPRYALESMAFGGAILYIIYLVMSNDEPGTIIPIVSFYVFAAYRLMPAMQEVFSSSAQIRFNQPLLDRIHAELSGGSPAAADDAAEICDGGALPFLHSFSLQNVHYSYPLSSKVILEDISMEIKRGTSIGLAGLTGAGKTTLIDIMMGLLTADSGKLIVDGAEISGAGVERWKKNLGYVPQDIFLSNDTVRNNIAFGVPEADIQPEQVIRAARVAHIHDFISEQLPEGYDTNIGERGIRLSGGQRQRIGIARALYNDPEVLILDEATNSLDGVTEESFVEALADLARVKTIIIIAHRLNTLKNCELIYLLSDRRIVDQGSYDELILRSNLFRAMARIPAAEHC